MKSLITPVLFTAALLGSRNALANSTTPPQRLVDKTYATFGLQGVGIGLGKSHSSTLGYRVDLNGGKLSTDGVESGTRYQGELELQSAGVYIDYFPWAGSFRLSAGLAYFGSKLSLGASGTGQTADINGRPVVFGPNDRIDASVDWPNVAPYIGLGFGHGQSAKSGLYLGADLGAYVGSFKSSLTVSPNLRAQLGPTADADIQREREELEDAVGKLGFLPSLQFYLGYRF